MLIYLRVAISVMTLAVSAYSVPLYFQFTHEDSTLEVAVHLLLFVVALVVFVMPMK